MIELDTGNDLAVGEDAEDCLPFCVRVTRTPSVWIVGEVICEAVISGENYMSRIGENLFFEPDGGLTSVFRKEVVEVIKKISQENGTVIRHRLKEFLYLVVFVMDVADYENFRHFIEKVGKVVRYLRCRVILMNMKRFVNLKDDHFVYFLGRYWADGWSKYHAISCKEEDFLHMKSWVESFGFEPWNRQAIRNGKNFGKPQMGVYFVDSDFDKTFLIENDFVNKSSVSPTIILSKISVDKHHLFWRGFFDGDGHVQCSKKKEVAVWGSIKQDWTDYKNMLDRIGIASYRTNEYNRKSGKSSCVVFYNYDSIQRYFDYIYRGYVDMPIGLSRKYETFVKLLSRPRRTPTSTLPGICYCASNGKWSAAFLKSEGAKKYTWLGWYATEKDAWNDKQRRRTAGFISLAATASQQVVCQPVVTAT